MSANIRAARVLTSSARAVVESLEGRQLFTADALDVAVNFQPSTSVTPLGYVADVGKKFGDRGNGFSYGWNADNTRFARQRNSPLSPAPEYDTHEDMYRSANKWEIAIPNGTYSVHIVAGDPDKSSGMYYRIAAEGTRIVNGKPSATNPWVEGTVNVTVKDGRLTLTNASGSINNRIDFVEIIQDQEFQTPVVSVSAPDSQASEVNTDPGTFYFSRNGDVTKSLTVGYTIGGTATNGTDYNTLSGTFTFAAGASDGQVQVTPKADTLAEGTETVTVTLKSGSGYTVDTTSNTASITIDDAGQTEQSGVLTWTRKADALIGRSEASGATVNGKMYIFGGYIDSTYHPTRESDVYDPAADKWTRVADLPVGLTHAGTAVDGQYVYIGGGYPEAPKSQTFATTSVLRYDTVSNTFTNFVPLPSARGGGALVILGRALHFFGGSDSNRNDVTTHWSLNFDDANPQWVVAPPMLKPRNHLGGAVVDGKIYAIAGQTGQDEKAVLSGEMDVFDPVANNGTGAWTLLTSLNPPRSHVAHSTVVYNGKIITMGGEGANDSDLATVSEYDLATDTWTDLTKLPAGRKSGIAELIGDNIYFSTGGNAGFNKTTWVGQFSS